MTTPQSGREAFEALVEKWRDIARGTRPSGTWNGNDLADRYEWCADELEAALAQQGREVGDQTCCDRAYKDGYDTGKMHATAPKQQAVSSTFVGWLVAVMPPGTVIGNPVWWAERIARRYALLAALPGKTEVDRG